MADYRAVRWRVQPGAAITLPVPFCGPVIFHKRPLEGALLRHELCHVRQLRRWGNIPYVCKHVWARVTSRSLMAKDHPVEKECYDDAEG